MKLLRNPFNWLRGLYLMGVVLTSFNAFSQQPITTIEYFFDADDRGFGNNSTLPVTGNFEGTMEAVMLQTIATQGLDNGFHQLNLRARNEEGTWSHNESSIFFIQQVTQPGPFPVTAGEYFFDDDDLGFGNNPEVTLSAPGLVIEFIDQRFLESLPIGFHKITYRFRSGQGTWTHNETSVFFVTENAGGQSLPVALTRGEYFFDGEDLGHGQNPLLDISSFGEKTVLDFTAGFLVDGLSEGFHEITFRFQNKEGVWSHDEQAIFFITPVGGSNDQVPRGIVRGEYFLDGNDLGIGLNEAVTVGFVEGRTVLNFLTEVPIAGLVPGEHIITYRFQNEDGRWTHNESAGFIIPTSSYPVRPGAGYALAFSGDDHVQVDTVTITDALSVEAWIYSPGSTGTIISDYNGTLGYELSIADQGKLQVNASGSITTSNAGTVPVDQWTHVAFTHEEGNVNLYINGQPVASRNGAPVTPLNGSIFIGRSQLGGNYFQGSLDEIRVWDRALTLEEIRSGMTKKLKEDHPNYANHLKAYYRFDEGEGTAVADIITLRQGTVTGASWQISGASLGDESIFSYNSSTLDLSHPSGDSFTVESPSGGMEGLHLYRVDQAPNVVDLPNGFGGLSFSRYYGYFLVNPVNSQVNITYNYQGNPFVNAQNEETLNLAVRKNNASSAWDNGQALLDVTNQRLLASDSASTGEYVLGEGIAVKIQPGDRANDPIVITNLPFTDTRDLTVYNDDFTGPGNQPSPDVFYKFTIPPCTDSLTISLCNSTFDTYIHVLDQLGNEVLSNDNGCPGGNGSFISTNDLAGGASYVLVVEGAGTSAGQMDLEIEAIPVVDDLVADTQVCAPGQPSALIRAVDFGPDSNYQWSTGESGKQITATENGIYQVTFTSGPCVVRDEVIVVLDDSAAPLTGPASARLNEAVAFTYGDDFGELAWEISEDNVSWSALDETGNSLATSFDREGVYYIRVRQDFFGCSTAVSQALAIEVSDLVGDSFGNPFTLELTAGLLHVTGSNTGFSDQFSVGTGGQRSPDVFYSFSAPVCADSITVATCGSDFNTVLHILDADRSLLLSSDDTCDDDAQLTTTVTPGSLYFIVVEGFGTATGNITMSIETTGLTLDLGEDVALCDGQEVTLSPGIDDPAATFTWFPGGETTPQVTVGQAGEYILQVDRGGCLLRDTIQVNLAPELVVGAVNHVIPANGARDLTLPLTLFWSPTLNASTYDLFIWEDGTSRPDQPFETGLATNGFVIDDQLDLGKTYRWQVRAWNFCQTLSAEGPVWSFSLEDLPDLVIAQIAFDPGRLFPGDDIVLEWSYFNAGLKATGPASVTSEIYLSRDDSLDMSSDILLGTLSSDTLDLEPGESALQTDTLPVPSTAPPGEYLVFITFTANVQEANVHNNFSLANDLLVVEAVPLPDLAVSNLSFPMNPLSGGIVDYSYELKNIGTAPIDKIFRDRVYLSDSSVFDISGTILVATHENVEIITEENGVILDPPLETFELLPGEVATVHLSFTIPTNLRGNFFFHTRADAFGLVTEANETNNIATSGPVAITLAPTPDLAALDISGPVTGEAGTLVEVNWQVENQGSGAPFAGSWIDAIYLSPSPDCDDLADCGILVGQFAYFQDANAPLGLGSTYQGQDQVFLPADLEGVFYFYLVTDVTDVVEEPGDNNRYISASAITITPATDPPPGPCGDNFANACVIDIPNNNYGYGLIPFNNLDLTHATVEPGEQFSPGIPGQKSLWYRFRVPTSRYVRINVEERDNQAHLGNTQVGVSVFTQPKISGLPKVTLPDGTSDLSSFVQLNQFGNTFEKCLEEGVYFVRFSADNYLDDVPLNATLEVRSPEEFVALPSNILKAMQYDQPKDAHVFPFPIGHRWRDVVFETGCLSVDNQDEVMPLLGTNFKEYDQSAWFVFKTDDYNDALRIQLNALSDFKDINKVGYRLYRGDARTLPINSLVLEEEAIFERITRSRFLVEVPFSDNACNLEDEVFYSIQLFFYKNYENRFILSIHDLGTAPTQGADPLNPVTLGALPKSDTPPVLNDFGGVLVPGGTRTAVSNYFACNAYMIDQPACPVLPGLGYYLAASDTFDLNQWYSFSFDEDVNFWVNNNGRGSKYFRLYQGDVQQACVAGQTIDLIHESTGRFGAFRGVCVSAGAYSLQVLGTSYEEDVLSSESNLGRENDLEFYVMTLQQSHQFNLSAADRIEKINFDQTTGTWFPLMDSLDYLGTPDTLGCALTVLPAGPLCGENEVIQGAVYRTINIDRPGELFISNTSPFRHRFYRGDAAALATGFTPADEIVFTDDLTSGNCFTTLLPGTSNFCVTPGIYTLVSLGVSSNVGAVSAPVFTFFGQPGGAPQFTDPTSPEDLGDITAALIAGETVQSSSTFITCESNPLVIDGEAPCRPRHDKLFFRQFFLNSPQLVQVTGSPHAGAATSPSIRLYQGKVSEGIETLVRHDPALSNDGRNGCKHGSSGRSSQWTSNLDLCDPKPLPPGWYTVVYYASGGSYDGMTDEYYIRSAARFSNSISIRRVSPGGALTSTFNRPHLASGEGELSWERDQQTPGAYPLFSKTYTFAEATLNECLPDAPAVSAFQDFPEGYNRVTYYTFNIKYNSFARFSGYRKGEIYPFDVRQDSTSLKIGGPNRVEPLSPCAGGHEYCNLLPGVYTLVVYSRDGDRRVRPSAYIDKVLDSRFDFARQAYDLGEIEGNARPQFMNMGDLFIPHPTYPGRAWTNDFFSCKTGASSSDPRSTNGLEPPLDYCHSVAAVDEDHYPPAINKAHRTLRKNLWYSFVVDGPGMVSVSVFNMTKGKGGFNPYDPSIQELIENFNPFEFDKIIDALFPGPSFQYPFAVYTDENVTGDLSYEQLMALSQVDTTENLEAGFVGNNAVIGGLIPRCLNSERTVSWNIDPCPVKRKRRYYVVVENYETMLPNSQVELAVTFRPVAATPSENDLIANAFHVNSSSDPFMTERLTGGTYEGTPSTFTCATRDEYDQNACGQTTIWYRFESDVAGKVRLNYSIDTLTTRAAANEITLYREIQAGTPEGLLNIPLEDIPGSNWVEGCLTRGVYYFTLTGCFPTALPVTPRISLVPEAGDLCSNPALAVVDVKNQRIDIPLDINCHSWGGDFGEDNFTNTACIFEDGSSSGLPLEFKDPLKVKSSWFKFSVGDIGKSNLTFEFGGFNSSGDQFVGLSDLAFRVFTGSCGSMTSIGCSSKQTTGFTLDCMPPNTEYYVQVTAPIFAQGVVTMSLTATNPSDPTCTPPDFNKVIAEFDSENQCQEIEVCFNNLSTQGEEISYLWDFGDGSPLSEEIAPCHIYPGSPTAESYEVKLKVRNQALNREDSVTKTIITYPSITPVIEWAPQAVAASKTVEVGTPVDFRATVNPVTDLSAVVFEWNFGNDKLYFDPTDSAIVLNNQQHPKGILYDLADSGRQVVRLSTFNQGCETFASDTLTVVLPSSSLEIVAVVDPVDCFGQSTGSIDLTVTGGKAPYQFDWGFSQDEDLDSLVAGTYPVTVTDAIGTTAEEAFVVDEPAEIKVTAEIIPVSCLESSDGGIDLTVSGGVAPYGIAWSNDQTSEDLTGLPAGDYTVLITDSNGCAIQETYAVGLPMDPLVVTVEVENASCGGDCTGKAALIIAGGTGPYQVTWDDDSTGRIRTGLCEGRYTFTVQDSAGCSFGGEAVIGIEDLPVVTLPAEIHACEGDQALLDAGSPGAYYLWSTGDTTRQILVSEPGIYAVQVSNSDSTACSEAIRIAGFDQGTRGDGKPVLPERSDPEKALGQPDAADIEIDYVSLGFGGSITLDFDLPIRDRPGNDFKVFETSEGNPTFEEFPEEADVYVSVNGIDFVRVGRATVDHSPGDNQFDLAALGLDSIHYIKVTDRTDKDSPRFGGHHDGFDLDGIGLLNCIGIPGCTVTASTEVFFHSEPGSVLPEISMICPGEQLSLNAGGEGLSYLWSTGETTSTISVSSGGQYTVDISDPYGCGTRSDKIAVGEVMTCGGPAFISGKVIVDNHWQTVELPRTYQSPVIVATPAYTEDQPPAVTRVRHVSGSTFEIRLQNPQEAALPPTLVYYVVVEEGVYQQNTHGIAMEAGKMLSTRTDRVSDWKGESIQPANNYQHLVVLGQVLTAEDHDWSTFWSRGHNRDTPAALDDLRISKHVGADNDKNRENETLGYIFLEAGQYSWDNLALTTERGDRTIGGIENNPAYTYPLDWNVINIDAHTAVTSITGIADNDGGWGVIYDGGLSSEFIGLAIDEDQLKDTERQHDFEMLGYLVFGSHKDTYSQMSAAARVHANRVSIYPNASTTGRFNVAIVPFQEQEVPAPAMEIHVEVFETTGKPLGDYRFQGYGTHKVDLSGQPGGYYFLRMNIGGEVQYHKVLVQNK